MRSTDRRAPRLRTAAEVVALIRRTHELGRVLTPAEVLAFTRQRRSWRARPSMSVAEAAWVLLVKETTVLEMIRSGDLEAQKDEHAEGWFTWRISRRNFDWIIDADETCPRPPSPWCRHRWHGFVPEESAGRETGGSTQLMSRKDRTT